MPLKDFSPFAVGFATERSADATSDAPDARAIIAVRSRAAVSIVLALVAGLRSEVTRVPPALRRTVLSRAAVEFARARAFADARGKWEIVIVDDNSPDGTADVVRRLRAAYDDPLLILSERPGKLGLGTAYAHGLKLARGEEIVIMDADLSHHPRDIGKFLKLRRERDLDVVSGTRYLPGGGVHGWDFRRKLTSRGANYLARVMLAPGASDLTGSFRCYKKNALETLVASSGSKGYVFQMEIIVRAKKSGMSVGEVPITFVDRMYGESKLGASEIVGYLKGLVRLFFEL